MIALSRYFNSNRKEGKTLAELCPLSIAILSLVLCLLVQGYVFPTKQFCAEEAAQQTVALVPKPPHLHGVRIGFYLSLNQDLSPQLNIFSMLMLNWQFELVYLLGLERHFCTWQRASGLVFLARNLVDVHAHCSATKPTPGRCLRDSLQICITSLKENIYVNPD